jgi:hypothetical protein
MDGQLKRGLILASVMMSSATISMVAFFYFMNALSSLAMLITFSINFVLWITLVGLVWTDYIIKNFDKRRRRICAGIAIAIAIWVFIALPIFLLFMIANSSFDTWIILSLVLLFFLVISVIAG